MGVKWESNAWSNDAAFDVITCDTRWGHSAQNIRPWIRQWAIGRCNYKSQIYRTCVQRHAMHFFF